MGTVTDIDGNVYQTVIIGKLEWMAENLKVTKLNDGTPITEVTNNTEWGLTCTSAARCWYNNDGSTYSATYGSLYNFYAVHTGKLAPTGWRVPTSADWYNIVNILGGQTLAGGKMKEVGTTHWNSPNTSATNESGFTALPGGQRNYGIVGGFVYLGNIGAWWSSDHSSENLITGGANYAYIPYTFSTISIFHNITLHVRQGFSIRCVREVKTLLIQESQFNWTPPTNYPFTKSNELYDKDINYIRANKKKLKPFDGITVPPNPGYNSSAYPGYETGLFGYYRNEYITSG